MSFTKHTKKKIPNRALMRLVENVEWRSCKALDIGSGPLVETKFLLEKGWFVDAVDKDPESALIANKIKSEKFSFFHTDVANFNFKKEEYDLIVSLLALPFINSNNFNSIFSKILYSLKSGGYLCISLFGDRDGWATVRDTMSFFTREEVESMFSSLKILRFIEDDDVAPTVSGEAKEWHIYTIIAKKL